MRSLYQLAAIGLCLCLVGKGAHADIPVIDSSNLTQHALAKDHTNTTKATQIKVEGHRQGIDCSVRQGAKNADAKDNDSSPQSQKAAAATNAYGGDPLSSGAPSQLAGDDLSRGQTNAVVGQQSASAAAVTLNEDTYLRLQTEMGSAQTLKGAYDQNSTVSAQNGMVLNGVNRIANAWVQALNTKNLLDVQAQSNSAALVRPTKDIQCIAGTKGEGTDATPCTVKACETVELSQSSSPGCVRLRYHDTYQRVVTYLITEQDAVTLQQQGIIFN